MAVEVLVEADLIADLHRFHIQPSFPDMGFDLIEEVLVDALAQWHRLAIAQVAAALHHLRIGRRRQVDADRAAAL